MDAQRSYLMLRDGNAAAAEFQKFIDHRGAVLNFPGRWLGWGWPTLTP